MSDQPSPAIQALAAAIGSQYCSPDAPPTVLHLVEYHQYRPGEAPLVNLIAFTPAEFRRIWETHAGPMTVPNPAPGTVMQCDLEGARTRQKACGVVVRVYRGELTVAATPCPAAQAFLGVRYNAEADGVDKRTSDTDDACGNGANDEGAE